MSARAERAPAQLIDQRRSRGRARVRSRTATRLRCSSSSGITSSKPYPRVGVEQIAAQFLRPPGLGGHIADMLWEGQADDIDEGEAVESAIIVPVAPGGPAATARLGRRATARSCLRPGHRPSEGNRPAHRDCLGRRPHSSTAGPLGRSARHVPGEQACGRSGARTARSIASPAMRSIEPRTGSARQLQHVRSTRTGGPPTTPGKLTGGKGSLSTRRGDPGRTQRAAGCRQAAASATSACTPARSARRHTAASAAEVAARIRGTSASDLVRKLAGKRPGCGRSSRTAHSRPERVGVQRGRPQRRLARPASVAVRLGDDHLALSGRRRAGRFTLPLRRRSEAQTRWHSRLPLERTPCGGRSRSVMLAEVHALIRRRVIRCRTAWPLVGGALAHALHPREFASGGEHRLHRCAWSPPR